jgi:predicted dehydrogenase
LKVLFVGLGSIALKHLIAIKKIEPKSELFALRHSKNSSSIEGVENIFSWNHVPKDIDFIIISNPTYLHYNTIIEASKLGKPLFIEKPPIHELGNLEYLTNQIKNITYCAFNMRFHPAIIWIKNNLKANDILEFNAYSGSFLPDWRPNIDYRSNYSSSKNLGGGVHLDLIHELDYLIWIIGKSVASYGFGKKSSDLDISSIDQAMYILNFENCLASIQLNYFRRKPKRLINITTKSFSISVDLLKNQINDENGNILFSQKLNIQEIYNNQMMYFLECLKSSNPPMNDIHEGIETLKIALKISEV